MTRLNLHSTLKTVIPSWRLILFAAICLHSYTAIADEGLIGKARELILSGDSVAAYSLLNPRLNEMAGQPDFDYLYGLAAMDTNHPAEAVFAFERVLDVNPEHVDARAELAKAYFLLGENDAARYEFRIVRESSIPEGVQIAVDRYLSAIEAGFESNRTQADFYLNGGFGYDSNINSATDDSTVAIPALGNLVLALSRQSCEIRSGFISFGGGFRVSTPIRPDLKFFWGADVNKRNTPKDTDFSTRIANGSFGFEYLRGKNQFRLAAQLQKFHININQTLNDGNSNRTLSGGVLEWKHTLNDRNQFAAFSQWTMFRYDGQAVRDVNQISGGVGWTHVMDRKGNPVITAGVFGGNDNELRNSRKDLGRDFVGVRVGGQMTLSSKNVLYGNVNYQHSRYGARDPLFLTRRDDDFVSMSLGVVHTFNKDLTVRPDLSYINNDSSLPINDFDRWLLSVNFRYNL